MSAASDYLEDKVYRNVLKGEAFTPPTAIYVSLHTATPGETGTSEISLGAFPAYVRLDAAKGGAVGDGWQAPTNGSGKNLLQLIYPVHDGASPITVTHFGLWDAPTGGNFLGGAALQSNRTLEVGDVFVVNPLALTFTVQ
jgi:hypothetical protein